MGLSYPCFLISDTAMKIEKYHADGGRGKLLPNIPASGTFIVDTTNDKHFAISDDVAAVLCASRTRCRSYLEPMESGKRKNVHIV